MLDDFISKSASAHCSSLKQKLITVPEDNCRQRLPSPGTQATLARTKPLRSALRKGVRSPEQLALPGPNDPCQLKLASHNFCTEINNDVDIVNS